MRTFLAKAVLLLALLVPAAAFAQTDDITEQLAVAGPLGDRTLGDPNAPVTMIEYASLTCSHCSAFYKNSFAALKEKYIDTGKVHFILREFPLDPLALAAAMLARCAPEDKYFEIIDAMFLEQQKWAFVEDPGAALLEMMTPYGFTQESFDSCIKDETIVAGIIEVAKRGQELGVAGTPAFFFNGAKHGGEMKIEAISEIVDPLIANEASE